MLTKVKCSLMYLFTIDVSQFRQSKIENFKYVVCGQVAVIKEVYTLFEYIYVSSFWTILSYDLSAIVCHFKTVLSCRIYFWIDKNKVSFLHCFSRLLRRIC